MDNTQKGTFKVNEAEKQFELKVDDKTAFIEYHKEDDKIVMTHTEAPEALRGEGVAKELVKHSLQHVKDNNMKVVPLCSYVADYIDKNEQWHDIVSEGYKM